MGYQIYDIKNGRFGGYAVPTICEHPDCKEKIDRGVSFACGGEPFSEHGCDLYFCVKHRSNYIRFNGAGERCRHKNDCGCEFVQLCDRCAKGKPPFPYKPETREWMEHILKDKGWTEWRSKNRKKVKEFETLLSSLRVK